MLNTWPMCSEPETGTRRLPFPVRTAVPCESASAPGTPNTGVPWYVPPLLFPLASSPFGPAASSSGQYPTGWSARIVAAYPHRCHW